MQLGGETGGDEEGGGDDEGELYVDQPSGIKCDVSFSSSAAPAPRLFLDSLTERRMEGVGTTGDNRRRAKCFCAQLVL